MPNLLLAFMAIFFVSCATHSTNSNMRKVPASDGYYFDAMTSTKR